MNFSLRNPLILVTISIVAGMSGSLLIELFDTPSQQELIQEFYEVENAVHVSPHHIRKHIAEGDSSFILVDLRSQQEYQDEHVVGAVNIPAYVDPDTSAYGDVDRIVNSFKTLEMDNPEKDIIVYCYSIPCMTGRKIGQILSEHGVYVKHLGVGWNEWRYHWELWNHPHEWSQTNVLDFISSGAEPGTYSGEIDIAPCIEGKLGC